MSDEMNPWLAQMYGTNGAGEETTKVAHADLFCKLAADNNIDLSQLSQEEVGNLYLNTFPEEAMKLAQDEEEEKKKKEEEEEEEEEKESAAYAYHQAQLGMQEKIAEADLMGRVMAHAMTHELGLIKEGGGGARSASTAEWEAASKAKADAAHKAKQEAMYGGPAQAGKGGSGGKQISTKEWSRGVKKEKARRFLKGPKGRKAALIGAGVLAAGAGGYAAHKAMKGKKKAASAAAAFEELAANHAVKVASAGGYDEDEAFDRVNAVFTLGLDETEKVAYVQDTDDAIHVRALEYLEAANYPVNWDEVFGE